MKRINIKRIAAGPSQVNAATLMKIVAGLLGVMLSFGASANATPIGLDCCTCVCRNQRCPIDCEAEGEYDGNARMCPPCGATPTPTQPVPATPTRTRTPTPSPAPTDTPCSTPGVGNTAVPDPTRVTSSSRSSSSQSSRIDDSFERPVPTPTASPTLECWDTSRSVSALGKVWQVPLDNTACLPVRAMGCMPGARGQNCYKYRDRNAGAGCGGLEARISCETRSNFFTDPLSEKDRKAGLVEAN